LNDPPRGAAHLSEHEQHRSGRSRGQVAVPRALEGAVRDAEDWPGGCIFVES
jgi:hypothetical protein